MTLSFTAPSFVVNGIPCIFVLLVIPATTMLPFSSKRTTAGLVFTSKESVNWTSARTTSPVLGIFPCLILLIVPQFLHFWLLYFMEETIILVIFPYFCIGFYHVCK